MAKRKRGEPNIGEKIEKHCNDVSKALKAAKGLERQRYSKRLHEEKVEPEKKERLEREVTVLKSLDLHQTARAHLYSSILKVKDLAASPNLPEDIRTGVPKPELTPEEQAALHNVTSGLYNRELVKQAITRAITTFCQALDVPLPGKAKRVRKSKKDEQEEQPSDRIEEDIKPEAKPTEENVRASIEKEEEEESEFEGFSDNDDPVQEPEELDSEEESKEEKSLSRYEHLLGGSSDSDSDDFDDERFEKFKGKEKVNLDDISVSGSDAAPGLGSESEPESDAEEELSISASPSPPPAKKKKKKAAFAPGDRDFLPTLMGGYISGSESASDVDVAPAKKRRGQRARQAIWEKKFGNKAKHLQKPAWETQGGREAGWDAKRGAVEPGDGPRTPWKKGIRNPLAGGARAEAKPEVNRPPPKKDDEGPLHPSWVARKQAKDAEKTAAFAGSKITFD